MRVYARNVTSGHRLGIDENGLGARLGPLIVTAVHAQVGERGQRLLGRKLPKRLRDDLDDSKRLVAHGNIRLGEAWARAVCAIRAIRGNGASSPEELLEMLAVGGTGALREFCPSSPESATRQCWNTDRERFDADDASVERVAQHLAWLEEREVRIVNVQSRVVCTHALNVARDAGHNRFVTDLHSMEELVLAARATIDSDLLAVCGKVGGMGCYEPYFGPLAGRLHVALEEGKARSCYQFPGVGEIRFVRDADAHDPLVMLASLVGKYVRELTMSRITRFWGATPTPANGRARKPVTTTEPKATTQTPVIPDASGYNDPVTQRFVEATDLSRRQHKLPVSCFERAR